MAICIIKAFLKGGYVFFTFIRHVKIKNLPKYILLHLPTGDN